LKLFYENFKQKVHQIFPEPFYFVDRKKYDMDIVTLAMKKNCQFLFGHQVTDVDVQKNSVFTKSGNAYDGKVIIGADGVNSVIRRKIYPQEILKHNFAFDFQINVPIDKIKMEYQKPQVLS